MIKRFWSDLKVQVGDSWAIVLVVMLLIVLSFGVAYLSSQVIKVKPGLAQTKDIVMNPPEIGWCLYMDGSAKLEKQISLSDKTARQRCEDKDKEINSAGTGKKIWLAFCSGDNGCDGTKPNVEKSPRLEEVIGRRDSLINEYNDGDITVPTDSHDLAILQVGAYNNFNCGIYLSDIFAKKRTTKPLKAIWGGADLWQLIVSPVSNAYLIKYGPELNGTRELIQEYSKLRSKMMVFNEDTFKCQNTWPKPRTVDGVHQSCGISSSYRSEILGNPDSDHRQGKAIDISCTLPASSGTSDDTCTGIAKEMVDAVEGVSLLEVRRECSVSERRADGDGDTSVQVIHLNI